MIYREADGGDKIAAFERGMSDEDAHLAFETEDVYTYIVDESFLVSYDIYGPVIRQRLKVRLYGNSPADNVLTFLGHEAKTFECIGVIA